MSITHTIRALIGCCVVFVLFLVMRLLGVREMED
jgi:hypothetical protein